MSGGQQSTFSRESTLAVLEAACAAVGLDAARAGLVRLGENAIYRLQTVPVVVRIARSLDHQADAEKEVAVSRWLAASGVRAARAWDVSQPLMIDGHPVTFWHFIDGRPGGPGEARALGDILRRFHALDPPSNFRLPVEDVLNRVESRVERADITASDRDFLLDLLAELSTAVGELAFLLPPSVRHGDAHVQNLMVTPTDIEIIDFERVCWGQPEWDLAVTATEFVTAQFWTRDQYRAFVAGYGIDIMDWNGFSTLRRTQEFTMTTWLMQNGMSAAIRAEYQNRMRTIRAGVPVGAWRAF